MKNSPSSLLSTKTVQLNKSGLNIRYAELGDSSNPPVLLLHGVPENLQAWYAVAPLLAENYHVLAIDWPGFGCSAPIGLKLTRKRSSTAEELNLRLHSRD